MALLDIGVVGSAGRMGQSLVREIVEKEGVRLVAASERNAHPALGQDAGSLAGVGTLGVTITNDPEQVFEKADSVLEFSVPQATVIHAGLAAARGVGHVIGTTGLSAGEKGALQAAARQTPIFWAPNMSVGVNVLVAVAEQAAAALNDDFDIEILEMHHKHKVDAPSGTALALGEAVAKGRGVKLEEVSQRARDGITGERRRGDIGYAVLRGGDVVGNHSVILAGENEKVELAHQATSRQIFAAGAVRAAIWLQKQAPGLYGMRDMLGLEE